MFRIAFSISLSACVFLELLFIAKVPTTLAQTTTPPSNPVVEQEARDEAVDKEHIMTIWKALMACQKAKGKLPDYLSDLVPEFLPDKEVLLSPRRRVAGKVVDADPARRL